MNKIRKLFVFVVLLGNEEKLVMWPMCELPENKEGGKGFDKEVDFYKYKDQLTPLIYLSKEEIDMVTRLQEVANEQKVYFEVREYKLVEGSEQQIYPTKETYNA